MRKNLKVFLCGTHNDLSAERAAVLDAIRKIQLQHDSMEFFGARSASPIETCLEEVRGSDILVAVVGHQYGSWVPGRKVSFTEAEYSEGHRLGKHCLIYIRNEDIPVLPKFIERDAQKIEALERFKTLLRQRHTVASFDDAQSLAVSVAADVSRIMREYDEVRKEEVKEMADLAESFNKMAAKLRELIKQESDARVKAREAEIRLEFKKEMEELERLRKLNLERSGE